jgi:hypothetical protein
VNRTSTKELNSASDLIIEDTTKDQAVADNGDAKEAGRK